MTVAEVASVAAAVGAAVVLAIALFSLVAGTRSLTGLRHQVEELRRENRSLADEVRRRPVQATAVPVAATTLLDGDGDGGDTNGRPGSTPPRLVSVALSDPVIKAVAVAAGTAKAVRSFRRTA